MNTNVSGKKIKTKTKTIQHQKKKTQTTPPPKHNKTKPQENKQQFLGVGFPAQGYKLTLDHLSAPADSTAQDHTEDHAKYHHHGNPNAHCADDVEFVVKDFFDGLRAGLHCDG